jgi:hypothetical protein
MADRHRAAEMLLRLLSYLKCFLKRCRKTIIDYIKPEIEGISARKP